ncbi:MAG: hypothetical protein KC561_15850 [Myxococcales bacterium]|nr:hypothetical protein [Myxococcales bacterium]
MTWFEQKQPTEDLRVHDFGGGGRAEVRLASFASKEPSSDKGTTSDPIADYSPVELLRNEYEEAFERGLAEGRRAVEQEFQDELERLRAEAESTAQEALGSISHIREQAITLARDVGIRVARALAERIIESELKTHPESLHSVAAACVRASMGQTRVTLQVHPDSVKVLKEDAELLRQAHPDGASVTVEGNSSLSIGSVRLLSSQGVIEGNLRDRLDQLTSALEMELNSGPHGRRDEHDGDEEPRRAGDNK